MSREREGREAHLVSSSGGALGRTLLAVGTATYECQAFEPLDKVPEALQAVVETLAGLGYATLAASPGYTVDPEPDDLRDAAERAANAAPVVVFYYIGHGVRPERDTYRLVHTRSRPDDLRRTAIAARELPGLLARDKSADDREQPAVLIILDCCFAGSAAMEMLHDTLRGIGNPNTWVIASAGVLEYALQGLFAKAFCAALRNPATGPSQRFVSLDWIVQAINESPAGHGQQAARVFFPAAGSTGIPPFFPNPRYQPGLAGLTVADQQHWISRVRGGPQGTTTGFYLAGKTGRLLAASRLSRWIADPQPKGVAVVTGSPGTGKSALLALPVLLTRPARREELLRAADDGSLIQRTADLLPASTVVIAVHARGLNTDQVAAAIASALRREGGTASALLEELDAAPGQAHATVIVDAVDEATSPATLIGSLLIPLARDPGMRVVLGGRRHALSGAGDADLTIDLDADEYHDQQALAEYIHRLLIASEEPGVVTAYAPRISEPRSGEYAAASAVATVIAQHATAQQGGAESFLIGRLLALAARSSPEPAPAEGPRLALPASVAEALDQDLARLGGKTPLARALLAALAWAKGPGLPWENIWVPVARAIAEQERDPSSAAITSEAVHWLLTKAGAYVVEDLGPAGRSVYRPFHDLLAAHLRREPDSQNGRDPHAWLRRQAWLQRRNRVEQAITAALLSTVPYGTRGREWQSAHPYLRTYLVQHAAAAGSGPLSALLTDGDFLAWADPATLSPLLSFTVPEQRDIARIYRRARPLLGADASANAAYLLEAAQAVGGGVAGGSSIRPLYRTVMALVRRDDSLLTLRGHNGRTDSVAFGTAPDGRLVLASGSGDATVRVWDPATGSMVGEPLTGHRKPVNSVAFGTAPDGRLLLASGSDDGTVRVWDPATGKLVREPLTRDTVPVSSVTFGTTADGRLLLACGSHSHTVWVWDLTAGDSLRVWHRGAGKPAERQITDHTVLVNPVAFGTSADGHLLLAFGRGDNTIRVWDPLTGKVVLEWPAGHKRPVKSLAFGIGPGGHLLLASGSGDATIRIWDLTTSKLMREPLTGHNGSVDTVAFGTGPDGNLLLASGSSRDQTVRLWDPVTGMLVGEPFAGHTGPVTSVAFGADSGGHPLLASSSGDATVRIWDPAAAALSAGALSAGALSAEAPAGNLSAGPTRLAFSVAIGAGPDGRLLLASGSDDAIVRVWDPHTGALTTQPLLGHTRSVFSVAFGAGSDGRLLLASGSGDATVRVWDPRTGGPVTRPLLGHTSSVSSVAFGTGPDGRLLLASGSGDATIRVWDLHSSDPAREPFLGHTAPVNVVAFGAGPDGRLLLASGSDDATVRVWDPRTGGPVTRPLLGHTSSVSSVAFGISPDGRLLLASGSGDATIRVWDPVAPSGACLVALARRSAIRSIAATGLKLAIGDDEGICVIEFDALTQQRARPSAAPASAEHR